MYQKLMNRVERARQLIRAASEAGVAGEKLATLRQTLEDIEAKRQNTDRRRQEVRRTVEQGWRETVDSVNEIISLLDELERRKQ